MLDLLDGALAVDPDHRPDIRIFVGDGHYACEPMVTGLADRGLILVSKLRRDAVLWWPYPGRPRKYAGRWDRRTLGSLPHIDLSEEGLRLYPAQLYYKPFQQLLQVVFVLDSEADPAETTPTTLFGTDPEMDPEQVHRIYRDRFPIEFNFRDAKQHLGLGACQARTTDRHHFHVNAVRAALDRFSMVNLKLRSFLQLVLQRIFDLVGSGPTLQKHRPALQALLTLGQIEPLPP